MGFCRLKKDTKENLAPSSFGVCVRGGEGTPEQASYKICFILSKFFLKKS
jgi:hypothetical protein